MWDAQSSRRAGMEHRLSSMTFDTNKKHQGHEIAYSIRRYGTGTCMNREVDELGHSLQSGRLRTTGTAALVMNKAGRNASALRPRLRGTRFAAGAGNCIHGLHVLRSLDLRYRDHPTSSSWAILHGKCIAIASCACGNPDSVKVHPRVTAQGLRLSHNKFPSSLAPSPGLPTMEPRKPRPDSGAFLLVA
ncbi:hypothetical protein N657DRAFT_181597 [Parathielavia appendiculata]|uniref:Uncharacterized protein n=1 Tax=Parathielavia appendiculata TaxID=2587402 RepID=A0AAN6U8F6_9PEZI|nr:hypothetical protein N657DRAFT_181597 [Parathielavia appendiculata]